MGNKILNIVDDMISKIETIEKNLENIKASNDVEVKASVENIEQQLKEMENLAKLIEESSK